MIASVILVSDNGPYYKAAAFARCIATRPGLTLVQTGRRTPQTNGVVERRHDAIQIKAL